MRSHAGSPPRSLASLQRLALASALLCAVGCGEKLDLAQLELPGIELPRPKARAASSTTAAARTATPRATAPRPAAAVTECDDLPSAREEELARLPPQPSLGKAVPTDPGVAPPYEVLPGVTLASRAAAKLEQLDRAYARRTREHLVVTSGTRDANRQARAMYTRLKLGADLLQIYRNKAAVQEIVQAYKASSSKPPEETVSAMQTVIEGQIDRGIYISAHLHAGAADIRSRTMSPAEKRAFVESAAEVGGMRVLEETRPVHYHLQID
jgi:hypothetical protein